MSISLRVSAVLLHRASNDRVHERGWYLCLSHKQFPAGYRHLCPTESCIGQSIGLLRRDPLKPTIDIQADDVLVIARLSSEISPLGEQRVRELHTSCFPPSFIASLLLRIRQAFLRSDENNIHSNELFSHPSNRFYQFSIAVKGFEFPDGKKENLSTVRRENVE